MPLHGCDNYLYCTECIHGLLKEMKHVIEFEGVESDLLYSESEKVRWYGSTPYVGEKGGLSSPIHFHSCIC